MDFKDTLNRLGRSRYDRIIGGVCAGCAETTGTPPWLWRAGAVLAALHFGTGLLLYLVLWAVMPLRDEYR